MVTASAAHPRVHADAALRQHLRVFLVFLILQLLTYSNSSHTFATAEPTDPEISPSRIFDYFLPPFTGQNVRNTQADDSTRTQEGLLFNFPRRDNGGDTSASRGDTSASKAASQLYDVIIVGGGAVGCPLARTLADSGKEVLLIERGGVRKDHPESLDIYGAGIVIGNKEVSQPVLTTDGVISHIGAVLSGGSAINMAIVIQETDEYFNFLETFPGVSFDHVKLQEAFDWTLKWLAHPVPEALPYGQRWRLGLDEVFGPHLPYRTKLAMDKNWAGSTSFDSDNNWFRVGSDVSLGQPGVDYPATLHVLLKHNVHKIEFEIDPTTGNHRATCVLFSQTTPSDIAPIGRQKTNVLNLPILSLAGIFNRKGKPEFSTFIPPGSKYRACVKPGGEIISSSGALLTPLLMYKSGIGPKQFVSNIKVPLVKEVPEMGMGLKDRVFIPVGLFFKDPMPDSGFPPRICQSIALGKVGSNCEKFDIGDRTLSCSLVTAEELSGARIAEGTIYATKYIVPPQLRNEPIVEKLFTMARDCADGRTPLNNPLLSGMCVLAQPLADCFRKVAANFYFTTEPKSIGSLEVTSKGEFIVTGNYLKDPQDLQDAMRGVANIIRVINSAVYDGVFQPAGLDSCPMKILNGLTNLVDNQLMKRQDISGMSSPDDKEVEFKEFLKNELEGYHEEVKKAEEWRKRLEGLEFSNSTTLLDDNEEKELEGSWFNIFGSAGAKPRRYWTSQRYATYPPTIPEPTDADGLKKFAKTWMTSIWHWVGSAQMGVVVDDHFLVEGFDNLRIVDASVLNQVTRMNPFFTLTSLGRYAGLIINEDVVTPPPV